MLKLLLFTFLLMTLAIPVHPETAKVYVWRNEQGILVFSDTPKPGAEVVITEPDNIIQSSSTYDIKVLDITPKETTEQYEIAITIPKNNATIRDNTGSIYISGSIQPRFKPGWNVQLVLDDKQHGKPQNHSIFSLKNIDRGEHKIKMLLLNDKGKIIASSTSVTFYMHRASIN